MRKTIWAAALLLSAGVAQAQVVSPLGGSTSNPQSPPPALRTPPAPRPSAPAAAPAAAPVTPAAGATTAPLASPSTSAPAASTPQRVRRTLEERFTAANTTHDGKLTLDQARAGRLRAVARDFDQIDTAKHGYVTLDEIKAHQTAARAARRAERAQKPAAAQKP